VGPPPARHHPHPNQETHSQSTHSLLSSPPTKITGGGEKIDCGRGGPGSKCSAEGASLPYYKTTKKKKKIFPLFAFINRLVGEEPHLQHGLEKKNMRYIISCCSKQKTNFVTKIAPGKKGAKYGNERKVVLKKGDFCNDVKRGVRRRSTTPRALRTIIT